MKALVSRSDLKLIRKNWELYLIVLLPVAYIIIFAYVPMYGAQLAFKDFDAGKGITGSPWVGLKHIITFFKSYYFVRVIRNTTLISLYGLAAGFPFPILLAIGLNEARNRAYVKTVQMVTYMPYFISTVVMVSMLVQLLDPRLGLVTKLLGALVSKPIQFMAKPSWIQSIYVWSGVWQGTGFASIIYLAALAAIDPTLYEASIVDGASKVQRIWHIDLPGILPTVVILLILNMGQVMNVGFEKIFLMQNDLNLSASEVIATYVYKVGLLGGDFSYSTAIGLFNSVVSFFFLLTANQLSKRLGGTSLW